MGKIYVLLHIAENSDMETRVQFKYSDKKTGPFNRINDCSEEVKKLASRVWETAMLDIMLEYEEYVQSECLYDIDKKIRISNWDIEKEIQEGRLKFARNQCGNLAFDYVVLKHGMDDFYKILFAVKWFFEFDGEGGVFIKYLNKRRESVLLNKDLFHDDDF